MPKFALRFPYFIIMLCLLVSLVGAVDIVQMPVDLFPKIDMPVVVVATFYNGMPPQQIEADITNTFERFFTLGANIDHSESRSLTGVSLIKIYFKPGTDPNAALSNIANLAMADLRRLPPGTLPPVVLGMDASTQPVCLVTLKGQGLNETSLKDLAQFQVRNQISNVQGASVPQPYGGTYRQIQIYVDPLKLEARNLSLNDVVQSVDTSNLILPAGDVRIGSKDYNILANSQFPDASSMNQMPLKSVGNSSVLVGDIGKAVDSGALQYNIVRIDGQRSVYVPVFKQGGDSNTITIVNGMKAAIKKLVDIPESLQTSVVFDQSVFVKMAIANVSKEALIGLVLTGIMILVFLGSPRAMIAVILSVPLSMVVCLLITNYTGGSINTMILGGLALVFSRLIDNGVIVLENIFRHMEMGESPTVAAEAGGTEVSMAVLAATFTTSIVFFPVTFFTGVSKYIFTPMALGVVLSIFASYFFAMTVVPLFCAKFISMKDNEEGHPESSRVGYFARFERWFNIKFQRMLDWYEGFAERAMERPGFTTLTIFGGVIVLLLVTVPFIGRAYFPRTDPGQFLIDVRMPSGTRLEVSNDDIAKVEDAIRSVVPKKDLDMIVSNIGVYPDLSAIYTTNASMDTAFVQVSLKEGHSVGSYEYIRRVQEKLSHDMPELSAYYQAGGLVDSVINQGLPAPIDIQIKSQNMEGSFALATQLASKIKAMPDVSNVYIPQSIDYPGLKLNIDRERASLIGLSAKEVVDDVITALTSDGMVAPSYWIDPKSGNNYLVTVQYANNWINNMSMEDVKSIPLRSARPDGYTTMQNGGQAIPVAARMGGHSSGYVPLGAVADIEQINTPTEVDHNQIRRVIDVYVATKGEALQGVGASIDHLIANTKHDKNTVINVRGAVVSMNTAFHDFGVGLIIAILLVYLILMAQFASFIEPFIILMAIPPGLAGVALILLATGSSLNIMSLMGVIMMAGIVVSNSILIVEFAGILHTRGMSLKAAVVESCKVRLRPILMTSLATLLGMIPMALGLEAGSEQYAPLARAIIGGLALSVVVTMFLVPAVYLLVHGRKEGKTEAAEGQA